jgi:hypothetical protein
MYFCIRNFHRGLFSIILGFFLALLIAFYLGSFGLDWSTFYIDFFSAWIAWIIILPFILKVIKENKET